MNFMRMKPKEFNSIILIVSTCIIISIIAGNCINADQQVHGGENYPEKPIHGSGTLTVYGYWYYRDGGSNQRPVRYASVEIWDDDLLGDDLLATTFTSSSGYYTATFDNVDGEGGTQDVYVRVMSDTGACLVRNSSNSYYASITTTTNDVPDGSFNKGGWYVASFQYPGFYIMDMVIDEYQWVDIQVSYTRSKVTAYWPSASAGDYYSTGNELYIGSTYQYARSYILYAYAQCIHYAVRGSSFPSGTGPSPFYMDSETSVGFALRHSWGAFLPSAVDNTATCFVGGSLESTVYADSPYGHGDSGDWDGNIVVGAVANVLWDLFDGTSASDYPGFSSWGDNMGGSFSNIWNVIRSSSINSIDDFWTSWTSSYGSSQAVWAVFYNARINKDTVAPSNPSSYSGDHTIAVWSNVMAMTINWFGATDSLSGIHGYSVYFDRSSTTIPDTVEDMTSNSAYSGSLSYGNNHYLHVRARDNAGNWASGAYHIGPFYLDDSIPTNPTYPCSQTSGSTTNNVWQNSISDPNFTWTGASDVSGIAGFYYYFDTNSGGTSSSYTTSWGYNPSGVSSGTYYMRVQTVDGAGNSASWTTLYIFKYDGTSPSDISSPCVQTVPSTTSNVWQNSVSDPSFTWSVANDAHSGINGYYYYWGTDPSGTSSSYTTSTGYDAPSISSGTYYFRGCSRDNVGNNGNWVTLYIFRYDPPSNPPSNPNSFTSSHSTSVWSSDNTIDITWSGASDSLSGVYGYSYIWDTSASTIPDLTIDTTGTSSTSPSCATGTYYCHIRTRDNAGNWAPGAYHVGPFYIDITPPNNPASPCSQLVGSTTSDTWQNSFSDPSFSWSTGTDPGSGIARYYYYWGTDPSGTTGSSTTSTSYDPPAITSGTYYLRVQTEDNVGNRASWVTLYIFRYDPPTDVPQNPTSYTSSHVINTWSSDSTIDITWSGASDPLSGIFGYSYIWDTSASTIPDTTVDTAGTSCTSTSFSSGSNYYFHVRARDTAGNWGAGAYNVGPFYIDTTSPTNPNSPCTQSQGSTTSDTWQDIVSDPAFTWIGASDAHSGLSGYYVYWGTDSLGTSGLFVGVAAYDPAASPGGIYYLRVRAIDAVGNQASSWIILYIFKYDNSEPTNPTACTQTVGSTSNNTWQNSISDPAFIWSGASDAQSGIAGYYVYWGSDPAGTSASFVAAASYDASAVTSGTCYLRVRSVDAAGKVAALWITLYVFKFDNTRPLNPTTCSQTMGSTTNNTWQNVVSDPAFTWSGASDVHSGIDRYYVYWGTSASGTSGSFVVSPAYDPSAVTSGTYYLRVQTSDIATNLATSWITLYIFRYDITPPTNPTSCVQTVGSTSNNTWQHGVDDPSFTWSGASDLHSGIAGYNYYWGTDPAGTSAMFSASPAYDPTNISDGIYYLRVQTVDNLGNLASWTTLYVFRYDSFDPTSSHSITGTLGYSNWYITNVNISLSGSDSSSGLASIMYRIDNITWNVYSTSLSFAIDGYHTVDYYAVDNAGNMELQKIVYFKIDLNAPVTSNTPTGTLGMNGWYVTNVSLSLTASDTASGVNRTIYRIDGSSWTIYGGVFWINGNGIHTIEYYSWDYVANNEISKSVQVRIDYTNPSSAVVLSGTLGTNEWYVTQVTISLSASDATSGVSQIMYRVDGGTWSIYGSTIPVSIDGTHSVEFRAIDYAGNNELVHNTPFTIDRTKPVTTLIPSGITGSNGWFVSNVTVSLNVVETTSGLNRTMYRIDGGLWTQYSVAFSVNGNGIHSVEYYSEDLASNVENILPSQVRIDYTNPSTICSLSGTIGWNNWYISIVTSTLNAIDAHSGISQIQYRVDSGSWGAYGGSFAISSNGNHTMEYRAMDNAGNWELIKTQYIGIDLTPPLSSHLVSGILGLNGWYLTNLSISLTYSDGTSGVNQTFYRVNGSSWLNYTGIFSVTTEGTSNIEYYSNDYASNVEMIKSFVVKLDYSNPRNLAITINSGDGRTNNSLLVLSLSAIDDVSGIWQMCFSQDNSTWGAWVLFSSSSSYTVSSIDGTKSVFFKVRDNAGNEATLANDSIFLDNAPVTSCTVTGSAGNSGWYISSVNVSLNAIDVISSVASTHYRINGGTWSTYTTLISLLNDGIFLIEYYSIDDQNNYETIKSTEVRIDKTRPLATHAFFGTMGNNSWYITDVSCQISASDVRSGINLTRYRINSTGWLIYSTQFTLTDDGWYIIDYETIDNAGNTCSNSTQIKIDSTPPVLDLRYSILSGTINSSRISIGWSGIDPHSGVKGYRIRINGGDWMGVGMNTSFYLGYIPFDTNYVITLEATDNAGNVRVEIMTIRIMDWKPLVIIIVIAASVGIVLSVVYRKRIKSFGERLARKIRWAFYK